MFFKKWILSTEYFVERKKLLFAIGSLVFLESIKVFSNKYVVERKKSFTCKKKPDVFQEMSIFN